MSHVRSRIGLMLLLSGSLLLSACTRGSARGVSSVAGNYTCADGMLDTLRLTSAGKAYAAVTLFGERREVAGTYELKGEQVIVSIHVPAAPFPTVMIRSGNTLDGGMAGKCTKR